ncbi:R3H domain-containing protein 4-like isoform X1 [Acropora millepora]|uniref:R3H domain-containing protein 4-like isoform X1 n=1 Tax=Acropora millepora TaxID=45264 RepID=UPI001CF1A5BD|nr:R3H domain-containing protein 4-like isoform X1 [Acropora millepora]
MGVLNIQENLRHRCNGESEQTLEQDLGWEDEFFDTAEVDLQPQGGNQRRQRSHKSKGHHYNNKDTARNVKLGSKKKRRHENTPFRMSIHGGQHRTEFQHYCDILACFLLSLVDPEEVAELDFNNLVNNHSSVFASLLANPEKMKIWNDFLNLSEEEQQVVIRQKPVTRTPVVQVNRGSTQTDDSSAERDAMATAEKSFSRIDSHLKRTLTKKGISLGTLKHYEKELVSFFSDDPNAVMISNVPSSFNRLLVHGLCQFLGLTSTTVNHHGKRLMEIANKQKSFRVPSLLLSDFLEQFR